MINIFSISLYSLSTRAFTGTFAVAFLVCVTYKIAAIAYQANTISHSEGHANDDGIPGK